MNIAALLWTCLCMRNMGLGSGDRSIKHLVADDFNTTGASDFTLALVEPESSQDPLPTSTKSNLDSKVQFLSPVYLMMNQEQKLNLTDMRG